MMNYKEIFKPTLGNVLLTILLVLILPNFAYWTCCLEPPCSVEYKIHFGFEGLLFQTGLMTPKCGEFAYFYFWPLSILVAYLVSSLLVNRFKKR